MLKLEQASAYYYDTEADATVCARTIQPSPPLGGWKGNDCVIREWLIYNFGEHCYKPCKEEEIRHYETMLGEWSKFKIIEHSALGYVSTPIDEEEESQNDGSNSEFYEALLECNAIIKSMEGLHRREIRHAEEGDKIIPD